MAKDVWTVLRWRFQEVRTKNSHAELKTRIQRPGLGNDPRKLKTTVLAYALAARPTNEQDDHLLL